MKTLSNLFFVKKTAVLLLLPFLTMACTQGLRSQNMKTNEEVITMPEGNTATSEELETATLAGGCFWCIEAVYQELEGVESVVSGYAGGDEPNPSYALIGSGTTRYAEVVQIKFDSKRITFKEILEVFWHSHNPTTLNRQGNDVGPQYRSVIFYHDEEQKKTAEASLKETDASDLWEDKIVTEISPVKNFTEAEKKHQDFYSRNGDYPYCTVVIDPKMEKFRKKFSDKLKK